MKKKFFLTVLVFLLIISCSINTAGLAASGGENREILLRGGNRIETEEGGTVNLYRGGENTSNAIKIPNDISFDSLSGISNLANHRDEKDKDVLINTSDSRSGYRSNTNRLLEDELAKNKNDEKQELKTENAHSAKAGLDAVLNSLSVGGIEAVIHNDNTAVVDMVYGAPAGSYPVEYTIQGDYVTIEGKKFTSGDYYMFTDCDKDGNGDTVTIAVYGESGQVNTYYLNIAETPNSPPVAFISMQYNGQTYTYNGTGNINADEQIYKDTQIVWKSNSFDPDGDDIIEVEWENAQEYYDTYGEKQVKLRVKDSKGTWSSWSEISFHITNRPPIPGLRYVILNPDSIINGQLTTNTQIAWLWSYNGEDYTYDPDGDLITQLTVNGISSEDIIGYLTGNIGFVTRFTVPGQYYMTYKCADAEGAWSEDNTFVINIEPADGNTRPVCVINYSTLETDITSPIVWTWANSYDPDQNDTIANVEAKVIKDGQERPLSDYITLLVENGCRTAFTVPGEYKVMFRVCDNRNAWSNWVVMVVTVTDPTPVIFKDIVVISNADNEFPFNNPPGDQYWFLEEEAIDAMKRGFDNPEWLYQSYRRSSQPESGKVISTGGFKVKGVAKTQSGEALRNRYVKVSYTYKNNAGNIIPVSRSVLTDSNGNFEAEFQAIRLQYNTKYVYFSEYCTYYIQPSVLTITCGKTSENRNLLVTTDLLRFPDTTPDGWVNRTRILCKQWYQVQYIEGSLIKYYWEELPKGIF